MKDTTKIDPRLAFLSGNVIKKPNSCIVWVLQDHKNIASAWAIASDGLTPKISPGKRI